MVTTALNFPRLGGMSDSETPSPKSAQEFYEGARDWLRQRARELSGDASDVRTTDLVHETMARLGRRRFASPEAFRLASDRELQMALHCLIRESARRRREVDPIDLQDLGEELTTREQPGDAALVYEFLESLQRQDATKARILELRAFGGFTQEQIATELQVSVRTIERQLAEMRERYKHWLGGRQDAGGARD